MIKKIIFILFMIPISLFAEPGFSERYRDISGEVIFLNNKIRVSIYDEFLIQFEEEFELIKKGNLEYIKTKEYEWLCLHSKEILILYDDESDYPLFYGISKSSRKLDGFILPSSVEATSYLVEKDLQFKPKNVLNLNTFSPWVEGKSDYGIGEQLKLKYEYAAEQYGALGGFVLINGFVSYEKPYLYEYNSRVKKIRIYDDKGEIMFDTFLDDNPMPQYFDLPYFSDEITIEILEVYQGSRWKDTCIHSIIFISDWVAPL